MEEMKTQINESSTTDQSMSQNWENATPTPNKMKNPMIAVIAVILGIALIGGIYYLVKHKSSGSGDGGFVKDQELVLIDQTMKIYDLGEDQDKTGNIVGTLKYGEAIIVGENASLELNGKKYMQIESEKFKENSFVLIDDNSKFVTKQDFETYAKIFKSTRLKKIKYYFQKAIYEDFMSKKYLENGEFFFSNIEDRLNKVIVEGDFDGNGTKDLAYLLENKDTRTSKLFIINDNVVDKKHNTAFIYNKDIDELPIISVVPKGKEVNLTNLNASEEDTHKMSKSKFDGVMIKGKMTNLLILYNSASVSFEENYQYSEEELLEAQPYEIEVESVNGTPETTPESNESTDSN